MKYVIMQEIKLGYVVFFTKKIFTRYLLKGPINLNINTLFIDRKVN